MRRTRLYPIISCGCRKPGGEPLIVCEATSEFMSKTKMRCLLEHPKISPDAKRMGGICPNCKRRAELRFTEPLTRWDDLLHGEAMEGGIIESVSTHLRIEGLTLEAMQARNKRNSARREDLHGKNLDGAGGSLGLGPDAECYKPVFDCSELRKIRNDERRRTEYLESIAADPERMALFHKFGKLGLM